MALTKTEIKHIITENSVDKKIYNPGSSTSQVAIWTAKIQYLAEHIKNNKKDHVTRLSLIKMVNQRKKMLKYLKRKNKDTYTTVIKKLSIRG